MGDVLAFFPFHLSFGVPAAAVRAVRAVPGAVGRSQPRDDLSRRRRDEDVADDGLCIGPRRGKMQTDIVEAVDDGGCHRRGGGHGMLGVPNELGARWIRKCLYDWDGTGTARETGSDVVDASGGIYGMEWTGRRAGAGGLAFV